MSELPFELEEIHTEPEPELLPLGIYYGLDEQVYHADPGLGSTSIIELATHPCKWQYRRLRPKSSKVTDAMKWGSAYHCRILEGKEEFERRYAKKPSPEDYPGALTTVDTIKDFLRLHGEKLTGKKAELMERAKQIHGCPLFYDEIEEQWEKDHPNHIELKEAEIQEIEDAVYNMQRQPILNAVMKAGTLMDGAGEVSIIYEVDGIRRKARIDFALPPTKGRPASLGIDLKSFTTFKSGRDEAAAISKIYEGGFDVQAAWYMQGIRHARQLLKNGDVYGTGRIRHMAKQFLKAEELHWVWIMLRRDVGMIPVMIYAEENDPMFDQANRIIDDALESYKHYMTEFGPDELWIPPPKLPAQITAASFIDNYKRGFLYEHPEDR